MGFKPLGPIVSKCNGWLDYEYGNSKKDTRHALYTIKCGAGALDALGKMGQASKVLNRVVRFYMPINST